jgi:hypothetical protein
MQTRPMKEEQEKLNELIKQLEEAKNKLREISELVKTKGKMSRLRSRSKLRIKRKYCKKRMMPLLI